MITISELDPAGPDHRRYIQGHLHHYQKSVVLQVNTAASGNQKYLLSSIWSRGRGVDGKSCPDISSVRHWERAGSPTLLDNRLTSVMPLLKPFEVILGRVVEEPEPPAAIVVVRTGKLVVSSLA
jgi:hypothetical protein